MKTDKLLASRYCDALFDALREALSDSISVTEVVAATRSHSPTFPEVRFCKGCVLPVVDRTTNSFLSREIGVASKDVFRALRCEGFSTLHSIYTPGEGQTGYSNHTWGTNYQPVSKSGKTYPPEKRGYQPCPDFGVVHTGPKKFTLVGEVKYSPNSSDIECSLAQVVRDLKYYVSLPADPIKGWDYDFGFGIAYAAGGSGQRRSFLVTDYWEDHNFVIACFEE